MLGFIVVYLSESEGLLLNYVPLHFGGLFDLPQYSSLLENYAPSESWALLRHAISLCQTVQQTQVIFKVIMTFKFLANHPWFVCRHGMHQVG